MTDAKRTADAKALVADVLAGKKNPEKDPALADALLFAVTALEKGESAWLEAQLKDARLDKERRTTVGLELRGPLRKPILTALGVPPFVIG